MNDKIFKFVRTGWLIVAIMCAVYIIYILLFDGAKQDIFLSLVFIAFASVMYYLNTRRIKMYQNPTKKRK